jgi:hypothetical protein
MRDAVTSIVEILGACLVTVGIGLVSVPAAVICAGLLMIAGSYLAATR